MTDQSKKPVRKRFFFFYNRNVQLRYALTILFIIFFTIISYTYLIYSQVLKAFNEVGTSFDPYLIQDVVLKSFIHASLWGLSMCLFVVGGSASIWVMIVTHRYEGPIIRINQYIKNIIEGKKVEKLIVRRSDEVDSLVNSVNDLITHLHKEK